MKVHRGFGTFLLGLGAISVAVVACSQAIDGAPQPPITDGCGASTPCDQNGVGGASSGNGGGGIPSGGGKTGGEGGGYLPSDAGASDPPSGGGMGGAGGAQVSPAPDACMGLDMEPKVFWVSADDSNSMASPGLTREYIELGFEPSPSKIRTYEFLNYYRIAYPASAKDTLSIFPEMAKTDKPKIADFQFAIRSFDAGPARRPMNFTFLIDTSGSMKGLGMQRARWAVHAIASQFVTGDIVNVVTTDEDSKKLEHYAVVGKDDPGLLTIVDGLTTGGTTDLATAFKVAYDLADDNKSDQRMNRVVFISDGGANAGISDPDFLATQSADAQSEGIYLVGIGTGPALTYNDKLMNDVTDQGRGAYVYIDSQAEADRILSARFDETMDIAARSVQVQVTLPWYFKFNPISVEQVDEKKVKPQYLAPNDAMVFFLQTTACDSSLYDRDDPVRIKVLWNTRDNNTPQITETSVPLKSLFGDKQSAAMVKGRAIVEYAEALKGCPFDKEGNSTCLSETERRAYIKEKLLHAKSLAEEAKGGMPDAELDEIIGLIGKHPLVQ